MTDEASTRQAFDKLFETLDALPHLKAVLEIEPYTVEGMLYGEKFEVERRSRSETKVLGWQFGGVGEWNFAFGNDSARSGKLGVRLEFRKDEYAHATHWGPFGFTPSRTRKSFCGSDQMDRELNASRSPSRCATVGCSTSPSLRVTQECAQRGLTRSLFTFFGDFIASWFSDPNDPRTHGIFAEGWGNLCKRLDATKLRGKQLELSAWVRTRNLGAHIHIDAHDEKGAAKVGVQSEDATTDGKWHQLKVSFHLLKDAAFIFPQCQVISD